MKKQATQFRFLFEYTKFAAFVLRIQNIIDMRKIYSIPYILIMNSMVIKNERSCEL